MKKQTQVQQLAALILSRLPEEQKRHREELELLLSQSVAIISGAVPVEIVEGWLIQARIVLDGRNNRIE